MTKIEFSRQPRKTVTYAGISNPGHVGCMQPRVAMSAAQHKIINFFKTFFCPSVFVSVYVFHVWPKTTLLPVWPRNTKSLGIPTKKAHQIIRGFLSSIFTERDKLPVKNNISSTIIFRYEGEIKIFPDIQKLREFNHQKTSIAENTQGGYST